MLTDSEAITTGHISYQLSSAVIKIEQNGIHGPGLIEFHRAQHLSQVLYFPFHPPMLVLSNHFYQDNINIRCHLITVDHLALSSWIDVNGKRTRVQMLNHFVDKKVV